MITWLTWTSMSQNDVQLNHLLTVGFIRFCVIQAIHLVVYYSSFTQSTIVLSFSINVVLTLSITFNNLVSSIHWSLGNLSHDYIDKDNGCLTVYYWYFCLVWKKMYTSIFWSLCLTWLCVLWIHTHRVFVSDFSISGLFSIMYGVTASGHV